MRRTVSRDTWSAQLLRMAARVSDELFKHGLSFSGREGIAGDASGQGFGGIGANRLYNAFLCGDSPNL